MTHMRDAPNVAALVLAAGQGTRFTAGAAGASKMTAPFRGAPLVRHVAEAALRSRARPVVVVTGFRAAEVRAALAGLAVETVHNPAYATGLASSLKTGLAALPAGVAGAAVLLGDMPLVTAPVLDALLAAFADAPTCDAVVPTAAGLPGNPVLLSRRLFPAIERLTGDEGARKILAQSAAVVEIAMDTDAIALDIDTAAALVAAQARFR